MERYEIIIQGLMERFEQGLAGFAEYNDQGELVNILDYEPTSLQTSPTLYLIFDAYQRGQDNQITNMHYSILARMVFRLQDDATTERDLAPYVNTLAAAVDVDPQLAGRIQRGIAKVTRGEGNWVNIGGALCRALDVYIDVLDKAGFRSGI